MGTLLREREKRIAALERLSAEAETELTALAHLDEVIRMHDPDHVATTGAWFGRALRQRGSNTDDHHLELERFLGSDDRTSVITGLMMRAEGPVTSAEIADAYVEIKGMPLSHPARTLLASRVSTILSRLRDRGEVVTVDMPGHRNLWRRV